jgi:hypothetical protein
MKFLAKSPKGAQARRSAAAAKMRILGTIMPMDHPSPTPRHRTEIRDAPLEWVVRIRVKKADWLKESSGTACPLPTAGYRHRHFRKMVYTFASQKPL